MWTGREGSGRCCGGRLSPGGRGARLALPPTPWAWRPGPCAGKGGSDWRAALPPYGNPSLPDDNVRSSFPGRAPFLSHLPPLGSGDYSSGPYKGQRKHPKRLCSSVAILSELTAHVRTEGGLKAARLPHLCTLFFTAAANLSELREPIKQRSLFELIY